MTSFTSAAVHLIFTSDARYREKSDDNTITQRRNLVHNPGISQYLELMET